MTAHSALALLLEATEHLAYRQEGGCFIQRRMDDGTLVPLHEWHHSEAVRLLAEAREALCAVQEQEADSDDSR